MWMTQTENVSTDSRTVSEVVSYFHMLWSSLQQVILSMVLLIRLLCPFQAFSGVTVPLIIIPLQSFLIGRMRIIRKLASSRTDKRVKVVSEIIRSIKLVDFSLTMATANFSRNRSSVVAVLLSILSKTTVINIGFWIGAILILFLLVLIIDDRAIPYINNMT